VQISDQEVMLKDSSCFQKSTGDEAATKSLGMGVVTHQIQGKVYFTSWSMDVMIEGENAVRHMDLMTHNHASFPGNTPTWPYIDEMAGSPGKGCEKERKKVEDNCSGDQDKDCKTPACQQAKKCMLVPHTPLASEGQTGCCEGDTPHHLIEVHCFTEEGARSDGTRLPGFGGYNDKRAPCVCVTGSRYKEEHGNMHAIQGRAERNCMNPAGPRSQMGGNGTWNYGAAKKGAVEAHQKTFPKSGPDDKPCSKECLEQQLDNYHKQKSVGVKDDSTPLRADRSPLTEAQKQSVGIT
jgi:hypothetical protein